MCEEIAYETGFFKGSPVRVCVNRLGFSVGIGPSG
jgi:hypothetical protein